MAANPPQEQVDGHIEILEKTVSSASDYGVDPKTTLHRPASHEESHRFFALHLPHELIESAEAKWHMGNFVIDRVTGEKHWEEMSIYVRAGMHLLYYGKEEEKLLHWQKVLNSLKEKSIEMGKAYDDPKSKDHIQPFIDSFKLEDTLVQLKKPNVADYATFNEFFGRELKEGARPVDEPGSTTVVSSPADCRLTAFPTIDLATKYWIKGFGFTLEKLLGSQELAQKFDGGSIVIARLAPQDYHRWHSPINGTVDSVTLIPGAYYTVNPQAESGSMDVFCENKRSVMLLTRKETSSPIAVIAVGAMLVGSIKYNEGLENPGAQVERGQCIGGFYYGGSTVINVYPKGEITLDEDLVKNSMEQECETLVRVGWRVGATTSS